MSAAVIPAIITRNYNIAGVEHLFVTNYWRLFEMVLSIIRHKYVCLNVVFISKRFYLLVKSLCAAMNPNRIAIRISDAFKVGLLSNAIAMTREHDCFHVSIVRYSETNVKSNLEIFTDWTL